MGPSGKISPLIVIGNDMTHTEWPQSHVRAQHPYGLNVPDGPRGPLKDHVSLRRLDGLDGPKGPRRTSRASNILMP